MIGSCVMTVVFLFLSGKFFQDWLNKPCARNLGWFLVDLAFGLYWLVVVIGNAAGTAGVAYAV